jgi:hypothetical protein
MHPDSFFPVPPSPILMFYLDLPQVLPVHVRKLQVLKHDLNELIQGNVGLIIVDTGLVSGLLVTILASLPGNHLAGLYIVTPLADTGHIFTVDEAVFFNSTNRDLNDSVAVLADDGLFRDDIGNVLADCLAHLLAMAQAVPCATIAPLG